MVCPVWEVIAERAVERGLSYMAVTIESACCLWEVIVESGMSGMGGDS